MELWTTEKPFDILLLKYWPERELQQLITELSPRIIEPEVAEALSPIGYKRVEYYEDGIVNRIIKNFCKAENLCTKDKYCHDVHRHSAGMNCVTAAAIRKRLSSSKFARLLGVLQNHNFQNVVMKNLNLISVRKRLGVLVFHCGGLSTAVTDDCGSRESWSLSCTSRLISDPSPCTPCHHALKVLYDNFYLYTAPLTDYNVKHRANDVKKFITNQIFRNSDCIVILVDDAMIDVFDNGHEMKEVMMHSLEWDIRLRILIIGVCVRSGPLVTAIYESMLRRPWPIYYDQFIMAPSGGLVSIVQKACKLDLKSTFMKYGYRINMAFGGSFIQ